MQIPVIRLRWLSVIVVAAAIVAFGMDESQVTLSETKQNVKPAAPSRVKVNNDTGVEIGVEVGVEKENI